MKKKQSPIAKRNFNSVGESDPFEDTSWVVVKKQRVTILLPPLPVSNGSSDLEPGPSQVPDVPAQTTTPAGNSQLQTNSLSSEPTPNEIEGSEKLDEVPTPRINRMFKTSSTSRNINQRRICRGPCVFPNGVEPLKQQLRVRNLKRKLENAGGLVGWLWSVGLVQFVRIFEHKPLNEFQMANLTMQKLKEMGAAAVGPRRKLMHAINCLSDHCPVASKDPTVSCCTSTT